MPKTFNLALLGYGDAGRVFHAPLIAHTPGLCLHTVVSRRTDPQIDVVIGHTDQTHAPLALAALAQGKPSWWTRRSP